MVDLKNKFSKLKSNKIHLIFEKDRCNAKYQTSGFLIDVASKIDGQNIKTGR